MEPFFTPAPTENPHRFTLTIRPQHCVGPPGGKFLMGGVQFAALIHAMEQVTEKPFIGGTIQFISPGPPEGTVELEVDPIVNGKSMAQMQGRLTHEGRHVAFITAALGERESLPPQQFIQMPDGPAPAAAESKPIEFPEEDTLMETLERRTAFEDFDKGTEHLWFRSTTGERMTAGLLAIIADFLMGAHLETRGAPSLDNTFRVHALEESEWVLSQKQITYWGNGAAHGTVNLFNERGTLLASGNQSALLPRVPVYKR